MCAVVDSHFVGMDCWEAESLQQERGWEEEESNSKTEKQRVAQPLQNALTCLEDGAWILLLQQLAKSCPDERWLLGPHWGLSPFWAKSAVKLQIQRSYF